MLTKLKQKILSLKKNRQPEFVSGQSSSFNLYPNRQLSRGKVDIKAILAVVVVGLLLVSFLAGRVSAPSPSSSNSSGSVQASVNPPKATQNINKEFNFPINDDKGAEIGSIKYVLLSAETNDQIILKGQKNYSISGREFLIINLKLTNANKQNVQINSRDYIRLSVNGNDNELLAPDIHNDPVEVQAISTEQTRVGFVISNTDKKLKLIVGEINGPKTNIDLNLQ